MGGVKIKDCTLTNCRLRLIGFAEGGNDAEQLLNMIEKAMTAG